MLNWNGHSFWTITFHGFPHILDSLLCFLELKKVSVNLNSNLMLIKSDDTAPDHFMLHYYELFFCNWFVRLLQLRSTAVAQMWGAYCASEWIISGQICWTDCAKNIPIDFPSKIVQTSSVDGNSIQGHFCSVEMFAVVWVCISWRRRAL